MASAVSLNDKCNVFKQLGDESSDVFRNLSNRIVGDTSRVKFQNAGDTNDAIIQPWRFASGMGMVLGSNFFLNTSGAVARFKDADESVAILLDPRGTLDVYTGASGVDATSKLSIANNGSTTISSSVNGNPVTSGTTQTLIGHQAGKSLTVGRYNTVLGYLALDAAVEDSNNVAIGHNALTAQNGGGSDGSATDTNNTAVGHQAGLSITTGTNNTIIGAFALDAENTGSENVVIGSKAMTASTGGVSNCVIIGYNAFQASNDTGQHGTTAIGYEALADATTVDGDEPNTVVGFRSGFDITTGGANTTLGYQALYIYSR